MRRLIVNADDLGLTTGINRAIAESAACGILTSATLMANSRAFDDAVVRVHDLRARGFELSIGCHVVLLDGEPVLPPEDVNSLLQARSAASVPRLRTDLRGFASSALRGKLNPVEIEAEADAQFRRLQDAGITPSHFDAHKHAHMFPQVLQPLLHAAKRCGIGAVRNPFGRLFPLPFNRIVRRPGLWTRLAEMNVLGIFAERFRREVRAHGLRTTDGSVGILVTGVLDPEYFATIVKNLPEGTWEFVCHPGYNDAELDGVRTRLRASRRQELEVLCSPDSKALLERQGIQLISYNQL